MGLPKWLKEDSTRDVSFRQETKVAKILKGRQTINSGATFKENDVVTDWAEIECKTTSGLSTKFSFADFEKLRKKCDPNKIPLMVFEFNTVNKSFALLRMEDLEFLVKCANSGK